MDIKTINKKVSVAPQIKAPDMAAIAKAGFKTIINNRPDNEQKWQPKSAHLKKAAQKHGLAYYDIPIVGNNISATDMAAFDDILKLETGPALAFCRTGTRSINLWALSQAGKMPTDEILSAAQENGYDLASLRTRLDQKVISAHFAPLPGI
jgi:sulfide:quinone oxidoreductase